MNQIPGVALAFLEPFTVLGLDRALLELLITLSSILITGSFVMIGSIIGLIRAVRRQRRGDHSVAAVVMATTANAIALAWLLYWLRHDLHDKANPINALVAINAGLCVLPLAWLVAALRANRARRSELVSQ
jgi:hypothetical protein